MSSRKYDHHSLKSLIDEMLKRGGMDKKFNELEIIECYKNTVGEVISKKTREIYLRDKTLVLKMDSGVLKQELFFEKKNIIKRINEQLDSPFLEDLEVR